MVYRANCVFFTLFLLTAADDYLPLPADTTLNASSTYSWKYEIKEIREEKGEWWSKSVMSATVEMTFPAKTLVSALELNIATYWTGHTQMLDTTHNITALSNGTQATGLWHDDVVLLSFKFPAYDTITIRFSSKESVMFYLVHVRFQRAEPESGGGFLLRATAKESALGINPVIVEESESEKVAVENPQLDAHEVLSKSGLNTPVDELESESVLPSDPDLKTAEELVSEKGAVEDTQLGAHDVLSKSGLNTPVDETVSEKGAVEDTQLGAHDVLSKSGLNTPVDETESESVLPSDPDLKTAEELVSEKGAMEDTQLDAHDVLSKSGLNTPVDESVSEKGAVEDDERSVSASDPDLKTAEELAPAAGKGGLFWTLVILVPMLFVGIVGVLLWTMCKR